MQEITQQEQQLLKAALEQALLIPGVSELRTAFDGNPDELVHAVARETWDRFTDYWQERFVPLRVDRNPFGGSLVLGLFPARPERMFRFWIYWCADGLQVRGVDVLDTGDDERDYWRALGELALPMV